MADTLDVITLPEAKRALNESAARTADDAILASYVTAVSRRMDQMCGPIVQRSITATVDTDGGTAVVVLAYRPITSVTSITEDSVSLAVSDYTVDKDAGVVRRLGGRWIRPWVYGVQSTTIVYVAGRYADTKSVQEPFRRAAAMLLAHLFRPEHSLGSDNFGAVDAYNALPGYFLPNAVRGLLGEELQMPFGIA